MACIGNHDFDFGLEKLLSLISRTEITWVMSNMKINGVPVLGVETHVRNWNGIKLGFIGVGDKEWYDWVSEHHAEGLEFEPFVECARRLVPQLRRECDMVIALTHMRSPDDVLLA